MALSGIKAYLPSLPSFPYVLQIDKWPRLLSALNWTKSTCASLTSRQVTLIAGIGIVGCLALIILSNYTKETETDSTETDKKLPLNELIKEIDKFLDKLSKANDKNPEEKLLLCKEIKAFWDKEIELTSFCSSLVSLNIWLIGKDGYKPSLAYQASNWHTCFYCILEPECTIQKVSVIGGREITPEDKLNECVKTLKYLLDRAKTAITKPK